MVGLIGRSTTRYGNVLKIRMNLPHESIFFFLLSILSENQYFWSKNFMSARPRLVSYFTMEKIEKDFRIAIPEKLIASVHFEV